jgi:hypothetical protein
MLECVFGNAVQVAFQKCFLVENLSKWCFSIFFYFDISTSKSLKKNLKKHRFYTFSGKNQFEKYFEKLVQPKKQTLIGE